MTEATPMTSASRLSVQGIHHVSFRVDNLDVSMDFYSHTLGFQPLDRPELGFRGAWLDAGAVQLHLLEVQSTDVTGQNPSEPTALANHLAFGVENLNAARAFFEERGAHVYVHSESLPQFWVQDPDGNVVEFIATRAD